MVASGGNLSGNHVKGIRKGPCRGNSGLSLLETLIATVIVSFLAIEVASFFTRGRAAILEEGRKRTAIQLAQGELERIETQPPGLITAGSRNIVAAGWPYRVQRTVSPGTPMAGMNSVVVRVDWQTRRGVARSIQVEASYSEPR